MSTRDGAIFELVRDQFTIEADTMLEALCWEDFTSGEVIALAAVLQPAYERVLARKDNPPVSLELVREGLRSRL